MMISMFDANKSGTIDMNEFGQLFSYVQQWRGIFISFDRDRSGSIEAGEFSQALAQMGFNLSPQLVQVQFHTMITSFTLANDIAFIEYPCKT